MLKKFLALVAMLYAATCFAAVDVNKASAAELDGIKGIGPGISTRILDERKKGSFKDWNDFVERVKGVGEGNAAKFSSEGLTINGATFKGAAAPAAKKDDKPAAKVEEKKVEANPVAAAKEEKKDAKAQAKAAKEAATKAKADEKMKKAEEAKAKKDAGKKAADAKPAAKDEKKDAKAEAAKPAASAPKK